MLFAVEVAGTYSNGTDNFDSQAISPDDFIGPFSIMPSLASPVPQIGLVIVVVFVIVVMVGTIGVKKPKAPPVRRKTLLDE